MAKKKLTVVRPLMPLKTFVELKFEGKVPIRTAQYWCQHGFLTPVEKIGRSWFVDAEAYEGKTGNEIADSILRAS